AVPGVTLWRQALPILEAPQPTRVLLAFDSDWRQNPYVARALAQATQALVEAGYTVGVETWNVSQGKGIDDVLAAGYTPTLQSTVPWLHKARTFSEGSIWIPGSYVSNSSSKAPRNAVPRRLPLYTNSKKPQSSGQWPCERPRCGRSPDRS